MARADMSRVSERMGNAKVVQLPRSDEAVLVSRARAGDRQAFEALVVREMPAIIRLLGRLVGHDADLPELANDVLLLGWKRLHASEEALRLGAFFAGVCVNVARNHLRSRRRRRWLVFGAEADAALPERQGPREALDATYAVLERLDEELRLAFALRFIDGRELTEVAVLLGVSLATAKRRLQSAEQAFVQHAKAHPALEEWVAGSQRWGGDV